MEIERLKEMLKIFIDIVVYKLKIKFLSIAPGQ